jgi:hypothetical protein
VFTGIRGKLHPAVSAKQSMKGAKLSTKFWAGSKDNYKDLAEQIIIAAELIKINEGVEEENTDVVILDKDGHAEFDMELHFEDNGSGAEVPSE